MFQIREVYDEAGVTGFWKGVIPTLIMVRELMILKFLLYCLSRCILLIVRCVCSLNPQVSNPSMQFMLYETMLTKLKKKRALKSSNNVTALEVQTLAFCICFV